MFMSISSTSLGGGDAGGHGRAPQAAALRSAEVIRYAPCAEQRDSRDHHKPDVLFSVVLNHQVKEEHTQLCAWMDIVEPTLLPSEPLAATIRYYKNHRAALQRFIEDPDIPIDNSPTEREFQNVAKLRLNLLFAGSTEGAHRACVLLGIAATCRALGISALHYMTWAFERLGTHRDVYGLDVLDVTPAAYVATKR